MPIPFSAHDPAFHSLRWRLLGMLSFILFGFFLSLLISLDWSLGQGLHKAQTEVLEQQWRGLAAAAEFDPQTGLLWLHEPSDRRLLMAEAPVIAQIQEVSGRLIWQSALAERFPVHLPSHTPHPHGLPTGLPDAKTSRLPLPAWWDAVSFRSHSQAITVGSTPFERLQWTQESQGQRFLLQARMLDWELADASMRSFWFIVGQDTQYWKDQRKGFRYALLFWSGIVMILTLTGLHFGLRYVLRPLTQLSAQIGEIENGQRTTLSGPWPTELTGVSRNLNLLLDHEREQQRRYREALANLAHSLKTPLAALQQLLAAPVQDAQVPGRHTPAHPPPVEIHQILTRMDRIVSWQLQRATLGMDTNRILRERVDVAEVCQALASTLERVYGTTQRMCEFVLPPALFFLGNRDDFYELLGNLLDNAFKFGTYHILVTAHRVEPDTWCIAIADDGPGISDPAAMGLLQRGVRLDEAYPGQGLGLACAREILDAYGGRMAIERSAWGGSLIQLFFPQTILKAD
jgi:two-component system sensor histidine kinase PhoQ